MQFPTLLAGVQHDLVDQGPKNRHRFLTGVGIAVQGLLEAFHLARVQVGQVRMHLEDDGSLYPREFSIDLGLAIFQRCHFLLHGRMVHAILDRGDHARDLSRYLGQLPFQVLPPVGLRGLLPLHFRVIFPNEFSDSFRGEEMLLQSLQHAVFQLVDGDGAFVRARALLPVRRAAETVQAEDRVAASTHATEHETAQKPFGPPPVMSRPARESVLDRARSLPQIIVNDPKLRHLHHDPLLARVWPRDTFSCVRVFPEGLAVVDQVPDVELVVQDAVAARFVAVDGGRVPLAASWAGYALPVQSCGDAPWRQSGSVLLEDTAHHGGLFRIDPAFAANEVSVRIEFPHHVVAVRESAGGAAGLHSAALAALGLGREVFQEEGVHGALEANVQFVDLALGERDDPDVPVRKALVDAGHVFLVAGQTIQGLGHYRVEPARPGVFEHGLKAGAVQGVGAADGVVRVRVDDGAVQLIHALATEPDLVVNRPFRLLVAGIPSIDYIAHGSSVRRGPFHMLDNGLTSK